MARPVWKGYLKLSLVTCAVELTNATTQAEKVSFRVINRETGNTVRRQYVDSVTGEPLGDDDEVKGYDLGDENYLLMEDEDFEAVQIESTHTLALDGFVERSEIEQIYFDTPYYMTPADEVSEEAFAAIREALAARKMAALARIVLFRRERPVLIEAMDKGMLLTTLRYDNTVRRPETVFGDLEAKKVDDEVLELAEHIIEKKTSTFDPNKFEDQYEEALLELIEKKKAGKKIAKPKAPPKPSNVVNLFEALKKSLAQDEGKGDAKGGSKSSSKAAPARKPSAKAPAKKAAAKSSSKAAPKRKSA